MLRQEPHCPGAQFVRGARGTVLPRPNPGPTSLGIGPQSPLHQYLLPFDQILVAGLRLLAPNRDPEPGGLLLLLAFDRPVCSLLLAGFLYWRLVLGGADWRWPIRALLNK